MTARRPLAALAAATLAATMLAACSSGPDGIPVQSATAGDAAESGNGAPYLSAPLPRPVIWAVSPYAGEARDVALLANLHHVQDPHGDVPTDWWSPEGLPSMSSALETDVSILAETEGVRHLTGEITETRGSIASERLTTTGDDPARVIDSRTIYVDIPAWSTYRSHDLVTPEAAATINTVTADSLAWADGDYTHYLSGDPTRTDIRRTGDIVFGDDGTMQVVWPDPATGELKAVAVPGDQVDGMLTDAGRTIRDGLVAGGDFVGFPEKPTGFAPIQAGLIGASKTEDIDCSAVKCVALTFDDGPHPDVTPKILDELRDAGVHATFFTLGGRVAGNPDLVKREADEGHVVASHSWNHPNLPTLPQADVAKELSDTRQAIRDALGADPVLLRPPYGEYNQMVKDTAAAQGQALIRWNVDSEDWKSKDADKTYDQVIGTMMGAGSIVLMHDIHASNVDALPRIIRKLREDGYVFVTIPTLLGGRPDPGVVYFGSGVTD